MTPPAAMVFVVDDDADHLSALCDLVGAAGHQVRGFSSARAALAACETAPPDALITDLRMPEMDGMSLLDVVRATSWDLPVILITGHGDVVHAVRAIQAGAEDFLEKPYDSHHLLMVLARALRARATRVEVARLQQLVAQQDEAELLGLSTPLVELRARIKALAPLQVDVVITGETGTGKELVARALHHRSDRSKRAYIGVNCAALPEVMFEIEMFGHVEGAFPGAGPARMGRIEAANGGTLMLDEIESMPLSLQAKLLRVLEERVVQRLGETKIRPLDLRVISTAKTDLRLAAQEGRFRGDLFYRLAGAEIATPPLRETGGDIVLLYTHFAQWAAQRYGRPAPEIGFTLRRDVMRRPWPGNVRELKAVAQAHALGLLPDSVGPTTEKTAQWPVSRPQLPDATLSDRVANF